MNQTRSSEPTYTKSILYPRPAFTKIITEWADGNWDVMIKADREGTLGALKGTVDRLKLPASCDQMRQEILSGGGGGPAGEREGKQPSRVLMGIIIGNLRYYGYIHREGARWILPPLTPRQIHLVRLMSQGNTLKGIARHLGVAHSTTRRICQTAMEWSDVNTSTGLVGRALYEGWIPGRSESENLRRNLGAKLGPGYITR